MRELEFHHNVTVLRTIGYLIFARKAVWILRIVKHTADKPLDGLSITCRERRLATRDVSVLHRGTCPFLRDLAIVLGLRLRECPFPLRLLLPMYRLSSLETSASLRHLAVIACGPAQDPA